MGDPPTSICGFRVFKLNVVIYGEDQFRGEFYSDGLPLRGRS